MKKEYGLYEFPSGLKILMLNQGSGYALNTDEKKYKLKHFSNTWNYDIATAINKRQLTPEEITVLKELLNKLNNESIKKLKYLISNISTKIKNNLLFIRQYKTTTIINIKDIVELEYNKNTINITTKYKTYTYSNINRKLIYRILNYNKRKDL